MSVGEGLGLVCEFLSVRAVIFSDFQIMRLYGF